MTNAPQGRMLVTLAASLAFIFSGSQTVDATKSGDQDARARSSADSKGGPSVVIASLDPLGEKHAVVLSWKASVPASSAPADAIKGYIVQRSTKSKDHGALPIHTGVVPGTSCTDDLVENDKTYYYVVRAVAQNGRTSEPSNEAPAVIPKDAGPVSGPKGPLVLCREAGKAH